MFNRNRKQIVITIAAVAMLFGTAALANFANDWVDQTSGTDAGYYKGSQRGYFTGGSFSARWKQSNDHLLSVTRPTFKSGCGGIDMFLGGFSFLDVDKLVQKLQRILAAAPAAAFDIALKTLAPAVAETIKSLEALIEKLNNLQIDDCKAAKALVATVANPNSSTVFGAFKAETDAAKADFMVSSGFDTDWNRSVEKFQGSVKNMFAGASTAQAVKDAAKGGVANCPGPLKAILGGGSVLEGLGQAKGIPANQIASFRGLIGDAHVHHPDDTGADYKVAMLPPCPGSNYQSILDGSAKFRNAGPKDECEDPATARPPLKDEVGKRLLSITNSVRNRGGLSEPDIAFMKSVPLPILPALRAAVQTQNDGAIIGQLEDIVSKAMAYQILVDTASIIQRLVAYANHVRSTQSSATSGTVDSCQPSTFEEGFGILGDVGETARTKAQEGHKIYTAAAANYGHIAKLITELEKFNTISKQKFAAQFGTAPASRAFP